MVDTSTSPTPQHPVEDADHRMVNLHRKKAHRARWYEITSNSAWLVALSKLRLKRRVGKCEARRWTRRVVPEAEHSSTHGSLRRPESRPESRLLRLSALPCTQASTLAPVNAHFRTDPISVGCRHRSLYNGPARRDAGRDSLIVLATWS